MRAKLNLTLFLFDSSSNGSFWIYRFYYSYFICSDLHRNGCQFNMSRNVFFLFFVSFFTFGVFLEAGAKVQLLFFLASFFWSFFRKFLLRFSSFFLSAFQGTSLVCGVQM
jgi:hypothetical protein